MTSVSRVQSHVGATAASATQQSSATGGDFSAFLQLLVTQIKNQDPMKPMDPTQTVTQLATFASVEQSVKTNTLLAALNDKSNISQAGALIGRTATSADGSVAGIVKSVTITDAGLVATLADGRTIALGSGVSIS
jgi:flagellar basal-body rod modification protein FlgD